MNNTAYAALTKAEIRRSIFIIGVLFFVFGFVTWINAILIPYFKIACELTNFQSYFVAFAFYISYFVMSVPAAFLLNEVGFKNGMLAGFIIMSFGAFIFIPAAYARNYTIFLWGLFTIGTGLAILQSAANPYITLLGPKERAAQRISIMGVCNKGAGILAPLVFSYFLLKPEDSAVLARLDFVGLAEKDAILDALIQRVVFPYACLGTVLFCLGAFVRYSPLPEIDGKTGSFLIVRTEPDDKTSIWQFPYLILGAIAIFTHVGTHVIAIDTVIGYAGSMGISLSDARSFPSFTLLATMAGYLMGIVLIPRFLSQLMAFRICTLLGITISLGILISKMDVSFLGYQSDISLWLVVALGFANSLIWAGIWPLALDNLGRFTKIGGSILITGLCGQAIIPLIYGYLADHYHHRLAYIVLLPCYCYLVFYAFKGYKVQSWSIGRLHPRYLLVYLKSHILMNTFTKGLLDVFILKDRTELGETAAKAISKKIKELLDTQEYINMVFGAAPSQDETLAALTRDLSIDWSRIRAFHMDEYIGLEPGSPELFGSYLQKHLFSKVRFKEIHLLNSSAADPYAECDRYADLLRIYRPDIVCMGIGENTHIAFNDPDVADFTDPYLVKVVRLDEKSRMQQVHDKCFTTLEKVPCFAMTMTIPALYNSGSAFCMVPGIRKADAVFRTINNFMVTMTYPSTLLRSHACASLYLDHESAYKIKIFRH